jgi:hypothetical protein
MTKHEIEEQLGYLYDELRMNRDENYRLSDEIEDLEDMLRKMEQLEAE